MYNQENQKLLAPGQISMAVEFAGGEAYPLTASYFDWLSQSDSPSDRPAMGSLEYQEIYGGDLNEVCYHNAATCPDCGQGMMRVGDQLACPGCGCASCGV